MFHHLGRHIITPELSNQPFRSDRTRRIVSMYWLSFKFGSTTVRARIVFKKKKFANDIGWDLLGRCTILLGDS